jgi:hypothetical protein
LASILPETSTAITISIPRVDLVWLLISTVLGRAKAIIKELKASNRNTLRYGFSFGKIEFDVPKPLVELIFNVGDCCFRFQKSHTTANGSNKNNQKNSGFKNVTVPIIAVRF